MITTMNRMGSVDSGLPPLSRFLDTTHSSFTQCHHPSQYPDISLLEFCESIVKYSQVQPTSVALCIHYMAKIIQNNSDVLQSQLCPKCLFVACLMVSTERVQGQNYAAEDIWENEAHMTSLQLRNLKTLALQLMQTVVVAPEILKVLEGCLEKDHIIKSWYWSASRYNAAESHQAVNQPEQNNRSLQVSPMTRRHNARQRVHSHSSIYRHQDMREAPCEQTHKHASSNSMDMIGHCRPSTMKTPNSASALTNSRTSPRQSTLSGSGSTNLFSIESILQQTPRDASPTRKNYCPHPFSVRANLH